MLILQMFCKLGRISTVKMLQLAATQALGVKMLSAIARGSNILINVARPRGIAVFTNGIPIAKLGKLAVETAPAARTVPVDLQAKLVHRELAVGMCGKESDQAFPALGLVCFSTHTSSKTNLRIILKLYHTRYSLSIEKNKKRTPPRKKIETASVFDALICLL